MEMKKVFNELPHQVILVGYILEAVIDISHNATYKDIHSKVIMLMLKDARKKKQEQELRNSMSSIGATKFLKNRINEHLRMLREMGLLVSDRGFGLCIAPHLRKILEKDYAAEFKAKLDNDGKIAEILMKL